MKPASPPPGTSWLRSAALWLGPPVARGDASIAAGVLWLVALIAALWAGAAVFGLAVSAVAALGAWQAANVRSSVVDAPRPPPDQTPNPAVAGDPRHRLPAGVLAGAVGLAGVFDTRLAGAVLGAAVIASCIVVGSLGGGRSGAGGARPQQVLPPAVLARTGLLIRCWMQVGVAAACAAAVARYSTGAALVLVGAAVAFDAGAYVTAAERSPGLRGPLAGTVAAVAVVFAMTGLSVPPFAPSDVIRYGLLGALTLPLGPPLARSLTNPDTRSGARSRDAPVPARRASGDPAGHSSRRRLEGAWSRLGSPWAVRRLDSLSITAFAWMWGLGLLIV